MDRITLEVIGAGLLTIAEEMGAALIRASYSSNIKERRDCSTAIFDARGQVIAQAEHIPMHLGSLLGTVEEILHRYPPAALAPGDMLIVNDPYTGGGTHLPDINLVAPVFAGSEHVTNTSNLPVECLELEYPLLVEEYALVESSGGPGRTRGGMGIRRTIEVLDHEASFLGSLDRARIAPWGLAGGLPGGCGGIVLNAGTAGEQRLPSKIWGHRLAAGDRVAMLTPGAGGYGPPAERPVERVRADLEDGIYPPTVDLPSERRSG